MRILFLNEAVFEDIPGGSRLVARELGYGLADRGHEVTFLVPRHTPDAPDSARDGRVRTVRYPGVGNLTVFVREGRRVCAQLWAEAPFDVVHTHFAYAALGPLTVVPRSVPRLRSFYGPWDQEAWAEESVRLDRGAGHLRAILKRYLRRQVEAANLRRSRQVVVLSEQSRGEVRGFGYPDVQIHKIPGGVDTERFAPAQARGAVRRQLGLPSDRRILLSVRRLMARMGLDNLINAMSAIVARHPDALLLIGGQGPERGRLEQLVAARGLEKQVQLIGFIPDEQLASYYQAADLFVLPTTSLEGFGLVTAEALACGTPVVGTPVGATPELLEGLDPRCVAGDVTPEALAAAVLDFLEGDWGNALTPQRLHAYVRDRYDWRRHVDAVEAIYYELVEQARHSPPAAKEMILF